MKNTDSPAGTSHFSALTEAEAERLALLAEECAEVIQVASKVLRHGYHSRNPLAPPCSPVNRGLLAKEVGHVMHAVHRMISAHDFSAGAVELSEGEKAESIDQWLHHQKKRGTDVHPS